MKIRLNDQMNENLSVFKCGIESANPPPYYSLWFLSQVRKTGKTYKIRHSKIPDISVASIFLIAKNVSDYYQWQYARPKCPSTTWFQSRGGQRIGFRLYLGSNFKPPSDEKRSIWLVWAQLSKNMSGITGIFKVRGTDTEQIRSLPFVTYANFYLSEFKVFASLKPTSTALDVRLRRVESESTDQHIVDIVRTPTRTPTLLNWLLLPGDQSCDRSKDGGCCSGGTLFGWHSQSRRRPIHEVDPVRLHNNVGRGIMHADFADLNGSTYKGEGAVGCHHRYRIW